MNKIRLCLMVIFLAFMGASTSLYSDTSIPLKGDSFSPFDGDETDRLVDDDGVDDLGYLFTPITWSLSLSGFSTVYIKLVVTSAFSDFHHIRASPAWFPHV